MFTKFFTKSARGLNLSAIDSQTGGGESLGGGIFKQTSKMALMWSSGVCGLRCVALLGQMALTFLASYLFRGLPAVAYVVAILSMVTGDGLVMFAIYRYAHVRLLYSETEKALGWEVPMAWVHTFYAAGLIPLLLMANNVSWLLAELVLHDVILTAQNRGFIVATVILCAFYAIVGYACKRKSGLNCVVFNRSRWLL